VILLQAKYSEGECDEEESDFTPCFVNDSNNRVGARP
jgi:hypothetical protein